MLLNNYEVSMKMILRKLLGLFLCILFTLQQFILPVAASDITGVVSTPGSGGNSVYNIDPSFKSGATGFRQYTNFNLTQGDIANLIFKYGAENVSRFVNLVDNGVNINGLLNTM